MASIPMMSLVAVIVPMILGMIIGNVDKSMMKFFAPMADILIPFVGLTLGAGINLKDVVKGGPQGILLGFDYSVCRRIFHIVFRQTYMQTAGICSICSCVYGGKFCCGTSGGCVD